MGLRIAGRICRAGIYPNPEISGAASSKLSDLELAAGSPSRFVCSKQQGLHRLPRRV
jgi:hypothetical protein